MQTASMERKKNRSTFTLWFFLLGFLSHNLVIPVMCRTLEGLADQTWAHTGTPPHKSSGSSHSHGSGGGYGSTPSHGGSGGDCGSTPSHGSGGRYGNTPSHGSGGGYGSTPSGGSPGTPSQGGGYYPSPPTYSSPPSTPTYITPPSTPAYDPTPTTPFHGGGYYNSPPTYSTPPSTPAYDPTPTTPSHGGGYYHSPPTDSTPPSTPTYDPTPTTAPPSTPTYTTPPSTPTYDPTPTTAPPSTPTYDPTPTVPPYVSTPTTPVIPDPSTGLPPFGTCDYWKTHIEKIWGVFGYFATVGGIFGSICTPIYGEDVSLQQALSNTRSDGIGALYREGAASLLNSMVNSKFPFTPLQVRNSFVTALVSDKAAASQAEIFKKANEGWLKIRA